MSGSETSQLSAGDASTQPASLAPQGQPDPTASVPPSTAFAALPSGGYGAIADAAHAAAKPGLDAMAADPAPVWNGKLAVLGQARAVRDAAASLAGSMLDAGFSPATAGLVLDPDSGDWGLPKSLGVLTGPPPTAATWLGLYHTLPSLMETDPATGQPLSDTDSARNTNIAKIAGDLSSTFIGDPGTGEGGAIPDYGPVQGIFGDPFSIRAAHDAMSGTLFSGDPGDFAAAWAKVRTPAEQAAARSALTGDIQDRIQAGHVLPGQLGAPGAQARLAVAFGPAGTQAIAANGDVAVNARLAALKSEPPPSAPAPAASLLLDAAGQPEVVVTGPRRGPLDYLWRLAGDLGSESFQAANEDLAGFANTSGIKAGIDGLTAFGRNVTGDIAGRYRAADSAFGEARYDLSERRPGASRLQNLLLGGKAAFADGKALVLQRAALPLGLLDGTLGAGLNVVGGGQSPGGLVGDDYYTNGLLRVVPAFGGFPEEAVGEDVLAEPPPVRPPAMPSPRNGRLAGQSYPLENLGPALQAKYPESVKFTPEGFPDFSPYSKAEVRLSNLTGDNTKDAIQANKVAGLRFTPKGYIWHHVEDGETMQLVPRDLHGAIGHTGGASIIKYRKQI
jgi:hypothetical protein